MQGKFIKVMPQAGEVQWKVEPWGSWKVWAASDKYEILVEATTSRAGTPLRSQPRPTGPPGLETQSTCLDKRCDGNRLWALGGLGSLSCILRAPTATNGLAPFCRDTFGGDCRLRVWERDSFGLRRGTPMLDASSASAALEVIPLFCPVRSQKLTRPRAWALGMGQYDVKVSGASTGGRLGV